MRTCWTQICGDQINVVDVLNKKMLKESFNMNVTNKELRSHFFVSWKFGKFHLKNVDVKYECFFLSSSFYLLMCLWTWTTHSIAHENTKKKFCNKISLRRFRSGLSNPFWRWFRNPLVMCLLLGPSKCCFSLISFDSKVCHIYQCKKSSLVGKWSNIQNVTYQQKKNLAKTAI